MSFSFNRKKDPNNLEELMVEEFLSLKAKNEELIDEHAQQDSIRDAQERLYIQQISEASKTIDHLNLVLKETSGLVDLHQPIKLYMVEFGSDWKIKSFLDDDEKITEVEDNLRVLTRHEFIEWIMEEVKGYDAILKIKEHEFNTTVQLNSDVLAFDYSTTQLVKFKRDNVEDDIWCEVDMYKAEQYAYRIIKQRLEHKIKEIRREQAEADNQEDTTD